MPGTAPRAWNVLPHLSATTEPSERDFVPILFSDRTVTQVPDCLIFFFFFFLAIPLASGSSWAKDHTHATGVRLATEVTMPDP